MTEGTGQAPAIRLQAVTKCFGARKALWQLSAEIHRGEAVVFWGPNGAGKTTVLRCVLGVIPFEGRIEILGQDVTLHGKGARRFIGYVPQEFGLLGEQTVIETIEFFAKLRSIPIEQAWALLSQWQLDAVASAMVRTLSGGMKQRLALAIALLGDPPILLLDEPTSHLDLKTRRELTVLLEGLKRAGKTLIFCSHRAAEIVSLSDRVLVLEGGRLIAEGTAEQLSSRLGTATLMGLTVPSAQRKQALSVLAASGITAQMNHTHLWVEAQAVRNAQALRLLMQAGISVEAIELENNEEAS